jgi:1-acyl-sn-glycerol-3-phosphate acyltransferase
MSVETARRPWFLRLARWYARRRLRAAFDGVFVSGLEPARDRVRRAPLVFAMNHVSWWDAFIVVLIDEALGAESYCLMDADNLDRLPFFGWIGAVPLHRSSPRTAIAELHRYAKLADRPGRIAWIFPQGAQRPPHLRPLGLHRGVNVLAAESGAAVVPVSLSYGFREAPEPTAVVSIGAPCELQRNAPPAELEQRLIAGLEKNDRFVLSGDRDFDALVAPKRRTTVPLQGRLLARLGGGERG